MICFLISANDIVVPSVSLEVKNIWIMQSLHIEPWTVLKGKLIIHFMVTGVSLVIICISLLFALNVSIVQMLAIYLIFMSLFDLFLAVKMPDLTWTNEMTPVKQGGNIFIALFGSMGFSVLFAGVFSLVGTGIGCVAYLLIASVIFAVLSVILYLWIKNK